MWPVPNPAANPDHATEQALAMLAGDWLQIRLEVEGITNPADDYASGVVLRIEGRHFSVFDAAGETLLAGDFSIDPTQVPRQINWTDTQGPDTGRCFPAIYTLAAQHFKFCAADDNMPRPTAFQTESGDTWTLREFRRC